MSLDAVGQLELVGKAPRIDRPRKTISGGLIAINPTAYGPEPAATATGGAAGL
jgi:hypothetical protein